MSERDALDPGVAEFVSKHRSVLEAYAGSGRKTADVALCLHRWAKENLDADTEEETR